MTAGIPVGGYRERLDAHGLTLPVPPAAAAKYLTANICGDLVFVAGQLPFVDGRLVATGRVGDQLDVVAARALARVAALNALAVVNEVLGSLDDIRIAQVTVFVSSTTDFYDHHLVADGASELLTDVLGPAGAHARTAIATPVLPLNSPVEVQIIVLRGASALSPTHEGVTHD